MVGQISGKRGLIFLFIGMAALSGCIIGPENGTSVLRERIRNRIITSNLNHPALGATGHLVRWNTPIKVNTNNIARADAAIDRYGRLTNGLIYFTKTTDTPTNGIVFIEGGSRNADGSPGCGNVTNTPEPSVYVSYTFDNSYALNGLYYVHLGSTACGDAQEGNYPSAIAEHELGHVLGIMSHFSGFTGNEGLRNSNMFAVIYNMYSNPIGSKAEDLNIEIVAVPSG